MHAKPPRTLIPVPKGSLLTLGQDDQVEIGCESGAVWITQDNDVRDVVLTAGDRFVSDRRATVLVYALQPTVVTATSMVDRAPQSFWKLLADKLRPSTFGRRLAMS